MKPYEIAQVYDRVAYDAAFRAVLETDPAGALQSAGISADAETLEALKGIDWNLTDVELQDRLIDVPCQWGPRTSKNVREWEARFEATLVFPDQAAAFESWIQGLYEFLRTMTGKSYGPMFLLRSQSQPERYVCVTACLTAQDARDFYDGPSFEGFREQHPLTGIATLSQRARAYRLSSEVIPLIAPNPGTYCMIGDWLIERNVRDFENVRFQRLKLVRDICPGFSWGVVVWSLKKPLHYQVLTAYRMSTWREQRKGTRRSSPSMRNTPSASSPTPVQPYTSTRCRRSHERACASTRTSLACALTQPER